jgi:hypothetical protein
MSEEIVVPVLTGRVLGTVDDSFVVAEWCDPDGPPGPPRLIAPRHLHRSDDEAWYVLEGTLRVLVGERSGGMRGLSGLGAARNYPHLLESRTWFDALSVDHDPQNLWLDSSHSRGARPKPRRSRQVVRDVRFRTRRLISVKQRTKCRRIPNR